MSFLDKVKNAIGDFLSPSHHVSDEEREIYRHESDKGHSITRDLQNRHIIGGSLHFSLPTPEGAAFSKTINAIDEFFHNARAGRFAYDGLNAGPGYSLGKFYGDNEVITSDQIRRLAGNDKLDNIYLQHDLLYTDAVLHQDAINREKALRYADELYIRKAKAYLEDPNISFTSRLKTLAAIEAFERKIKYGIGYQLKQLDRPYYIDEDGNYHWTTHDDVRKTIKDYLQQYDPESYADRPVIFAADIPNNVGGHSGFPTDTKPIIKSEALEKVVPFYTNIRTDGRKQPYVDDWDDPSF